jgi:cellulose synthase/poly-beta-1,6-N-acetylglucosamine synthase-like glycosyltransferase
MASGIAAVRRPWAAFGKPAGATASLPWIADSPALSDENGRWPELDCVRPLLHAQTVEAVERRSERIGVGADRVLIACGLMSEEDYLRALGADLGVEFESLDGVARQRCPVGDEKLTEAAAAGLLPLADGDGLTLVVNPRGTAAQRLAGMIRANPALARRFRFTTAERLTRFVLRYGGKTLAARATGRLAQQWPALSAAPAGRRTVALPLTVVGCAAGGAVLAPVLTGQAIAALLGVLFLSWQALRMTGVCVRPRPRACPERSADAALPVYSVIAALYREAASVDGLLTAIEALDYPPEKLDVILALEADDRATRAAVVARSGRLPVSIVTVPAGDPRTKPKALNMALPFARGTFTVIYDAEDRPEADQLRAALHAFVTGDDRLACVQAPLCIDNTADNWLTRLFTAEYAGLFDVFLPALSAMRLPLPLGGSSNHFRTATLRALNAWDPYNVTEDADLGVRLARLGYRAGTIASTTYEEAPARLGAWLRQRTRWFKGWMQTWLVHMRAPRRLWRELRLPGFLAFQLIVGGNVLSALVHPLFLAALAYAALADTLPWQGDGAVGIVTMTYGAAAVSGYLVSGLLGWIGLRRRGLAANAWVLILTPVHWLLLSLAAWRALYQLITAPYAWEKTEHGLAKSTRRGGDMTRALLALERHLTELEARGELPEVGESRPSAATNTSASRLRPRRGCA